MKGRGVSPPPLDQLRIQQVVGHEADGRTTAQHASTVDHISSKQVREELLLVLLLSTDTHLFDEHSRITLQEPADRTTDSTAIREDVREVVRHIHFYSVHIADEAIAD